MRRPLVSTSEQTGVRGELARIAALAMPIALAQFGIVTIGLVEVAMLGRSTPAELGGASIGRSLAFVAMALGLGVAAALEPLVAQALGAREHERAWSALTASLVAGTWIAVPAGALEIASTWLLEPIGVEHDLAVAARAFALAQAPSLALATAFFAAKTYLQARGRTTPALAGSILANVVNFVACGVLVLGDDALARVGLPPVGLPALGALGAGIANTLSNAVLAAFVLVPAYRMRPGPGPEPKGAATPASAPPPLVTPRRVLELATPIGLQLLAEIGVFSLVAVLAGRMGKVPIAAHQIAVGLSSFTFMGALGISGATAVRVGHAVGQGRSPLRAGLVGIGLGAAFMGACAVVFLSIPHALVSLFTDDAEIAALGARLMSIAAAFQLFDGVQGVGAGALRGAGDVRFPFLANVAGHWLIGLPLALLLGFHLGWSAAGLWWGLLVGLAVVALLLAWRFSHIASKPLRRV